MKHLVSRYFVYFSVFTLSLLGYNNKIIAQVPQGISYQAVIRNIDGSIVVNKPLKIRFSIRDSSATGNINYQEEHTTNSNSVGVITLSIGTGTPKTGSFSAIPWGKGSKYIQVELDLNNSGNYITLSTNQMLSVPYAMFAGSADAVGGASDNAAIKRLRTQFYINQ